MISNASGSGNLLDIVNRTVRVSEHRSTAFALGKGSWIARGMWQCNLSKEAGTAAVALRRRAALALLCEEGLQGVLPGARPGAHVLLHLPLSTAIILRTSTTAGCKEHTFLTYTS